MLTLTYSKIVIINWSDDVILQVDDVTFLVKKRFFFLSHRYLLPFRGTVYVLARLANTSFWHDQWSYSLNRNC